MIQHLDHSMIWDDNLEEIRIEEKKKDDNDIENKLFQLLFQCGYVSMWKSRNVKQKFHLKKKKREIEEISFSDPIFFLSFLQSRIINQPIFITLSVLYCIRLI